MGIARAAAAHDELPDEDGRTSLALAQWAFQVYHALKNSSAWLDRRDRQGEDPPSAAFGVALLREGQAVARLLGLEPGGENLDERGRLRPLPAPRLTDADEREEARGLRALLDLAESHAFTQLIDHSWLWGGLEAQRHSVLGDVGPWGRPSLYSGYPGTSASTTTSSVRSEPSGPGLHGPRP